MDGPNRPSQRLRRSAAAPWTDDRIELLKARWSQGASARQISEEFGCGMTRNAVLGKLHRLGIARGSRHAVAGRKASAAERARRSDSGLLRPPPAPDMGGLRPRQQRSVPAWVRDAKPYIDDPLLDVAVPTSQRRSFLELDNRTCRWPIGDPGKPDLQFCGAEPREGKPYCAPHCARAYRPRVENAPGGSNKPAHRFISKTAA